MADGFLQVRRPNQQYQSTQIFYSILCSRGTSTLSLVMVLSWLMTKVYNFALCTIKPQLQFVRPPLYTVKIIVQLLAIFCCCYLPADLRIICIHINEGWQCISRIIYVAGKQHRAKDGSFILMALHSTLPGTCSWYHYSLSKNWMFTNFRTIWMILKAQMQTVGTRQ